MLTVRLISHGIPLKIGVDKENMRLVLPNIDVEVSRKKVSTWNLLEEPAVIKRRKSDNREIVSKAKTTVCVRDPNDLEAYVVSEAWIENYTRHNVVEKVVGENVLASHIEEEDGEVRVKTHYEEKEGGEVVRKHYILSEVVDYEEVEKQDIDHYILKQGEDGEFEEIPFTPPREQTKEIVITKDDLVPKTFLTKFYIESTYELFAKVTKNRKTGVAKIDRLVQSKLWKDAKRWVADGTMGIFADWTWGRGSPKRYYILVYPLLLKTVIVNDKPKKEIAKIEEADSFVWIMHTSATGIDYLNAMEIPRIVVEAEEEKVVQTAQSLASIIG